MRCAPVPSSRLSTSSHRQAPSSDSSTQPTGAAGSPPQSTLSARLTRESSERERALALIARKRREAATETPSTVHGGMDDGGGYRDVYNRREVEAAHKERDKRGKRGWDGARVEGRERYW
jgi:hypothetical protein